MALVVLSCLNFIQTILLDCIGIAVISACIKKIKTGEFLRSHCNTEEDTQHCWHIMLYYFEKGKNATEVQKKDLCSVWRRCCD